jgi:hypothetical protein
LRVVTATAFTSQSTFTETISSMDSTRRWLRRNPIASASGAAPSVMSVTISLLVHVEREGMLAGDRRRDERAVLVARIDRVGRGPGVARKAAGGTPRSAADERHLDLARLRRRGGADLGVAIGAPLPDTRDRFGDRGLVGTGTKQRLQVVAALREEAREDLAVRWTAARACMWRRTPA